MKILPVKKFQVRKFPGKFFSNSEILPLKKFQSQKFSGIFFQIQKSPAGKIPGAKKSGRIFFLLC